MCMLNHRLVLGHFLCGRRHSRWLKGLLGFLVLEVDNGREHEDHVLAFVHDRSVTIGTADFTWKIMICMLLLRVVEG